MEFLCKVQPRSSPVPTTGIAPALVVVVVLLLLDYTVAIPPVTPLVWATYHNYCLSAQKSINTLYLQRGCLKEVVYKNYVGEHSTTGSAHRKKLNTFCLQCGCLIEVTNKNWRFVWAYGEWIRRPLRGGGWGVFDWSKG